MICSEKRERKKKKKKGRTGNYCLGSKLGAGSHYLPPLSERSDVTIKTAGQFVFASLVEHRWSLTAGSVRSAAHTGKFRNSTEVAAAPPSTRSLDLLKRPRCAYFLETVFFPPVSTDDYGSAAQ